jgi:hypothetical protein
MLCRGLAAGRQNKYVFSCANIVDEQKKAYQEKNGASIFCMFDCLMC